MKQIAIIGATASGKSALALRLARPLNAVILSLDSLCIYRQINIASAKPSKQEMMDITHFGVDIKDIDENFSAGEFFSEYERAREFAVAESKNLIITGGSGFYLKAMISGLAPRVERAFVDSSLYPSNAEIYALCERFDESFAKKFSANDTFRLQKWFDIYSFLGENSRIPPSEYLAQNTAQPILEGIKIYNLAWDKNELKKRIIARTEAMFESGILAEAKGLFSKYDTNLAPLKSIGLKECALYLRGEIRDENALKELIITHTCQLAKRQRTFFASQFDAQDIGFESAFDEIMKNWG